MHKTLMLALGIAALAPMGALADNAIDGTWKVDMSKTTWSKKPDIYVLKDGMYACKNCVPPLDVKADGTDQPVTGHPYYDTVAVKVVDDHTVTETHKKAGKTVLTVTTTVAADGKTESFDFDNTINGKSVTGKGSATRVAKGPAGSHAISGSWRTDDVGNMTDAGVTMTFKSDGTSLQMSNPLGQSYDATLDGTDAPFTGDPGVTSVSVKKSGKSVVETDKRDGKPITVMTMTISGDGKMMKIVSDDKLHGQTNTFMATKQ